MPHLAHLSHHLSLVAAILAGQVRVPCLQEDTQYVAKVLRERRAEDIAPNVCVTNCFLHFPRDDRLRHGQGCRPSALPEPCWEEQWHATRGCCHCCAPVGASEFSLLTACLPPSVDILRVPFYCGFECVSPKARKLLSYEYLLLFTVP